MDSIGSGSGKVAFIHHKVSDDCVVILGHGYLSNKESRTNTALAERLNRAGISTISYDMYGHGESEGDIEQLTVSKVVENVIAIYDHAKSEGYSRIGLSGSSFTGIVSLIAASRRDFAVLSLKCPVFDSKRLWDSRHSPEGIRRWKETGFIEAFGNRWGYGAYEDASGYDMEDIASGITAPVLVIHGDKDVTVPIQHARDIISHVKGEKELLIVEGADHFFRDPAHFETMISKSFEWLSRHLQ
jgi:pimeloyl-ACP methyl ester carboxylesterase